MESGRREKRNVLARQLHGTSRHSNPLMSCEGVLRESLAILRGVNPALSFSSDE